MCLQHYHTTIFIRLITGFNFAHCLFTVSFPTLLPGLEELLIRAQNRRSPKRDLSRSFWPYSASAGQAAAQTQTAPMAPPCASSFSLPARLTSCVSAPAMDPFPFYDWDLWSHLLGPAGGCVMVHSDQPARRDDQDTHAYHEQGPHGEDRPVCSPAGLPPSGPSQALSQLCVATHPWRHLQKGKIQLSLE